MDQKKVITLEDRIPKLRHQRKQRANRRLIIYLSVFFILILTVIYFQSPLSDVKSVVIEGNRYTSDEEIIKASGLNERTSFWNVDLGEMEEQIKNIIEISEAKFSKKLPNTIQIEIKEYARVAYLVENGSYYPILETGEILDELPIGIYPSDAPLLMNWRLGDELGEMAAELTKLPESLVHRISEVYHTPVEGDPLRLTLYMNDGFVVSSTIRHFSTKISSYPVVVKEIDPSVNGIIHMKINPYFEQFDEEEEQEIESEG